MEDIRNDSVYQLNIREKVFSEQVKILHNHLLTSVPANFVCALIVLVSLYKTSDAAVMIGWFVSVALVSVLRMGAFHFYRRQIQSDIKSDNFYLALFIFGMAASAILWGLMGSVIMPKGDILHQMLVIVVIAGVTAGGIQTLNASVKASVTYLLFILLPLTIWVFLQGSLTYSLLGITLVAFLAFMVVTSIRGHQLLVTTLFLRYENQALIEKISIANARLLDHSKTLYEQSMHDSLTGLFNRRYLDETLPRELQRVSREKQSLCVAMLDLDFFKSFNDVHGHAAGDAVLRFIGTLMKETFRESDICCRFGGEEFLVVLLNTDMTSARTRLESFRNVVKQGKVLFQGQFLPPMTVSIGVAEAPEQGASVEEIIWAADKALYYAKEAGRDRIESASVTVA